MAKRRKPYKPKSINIPITQPLIDEYALNALGNLMALEKAPSFEAFDSLAGMLNLLATAIRDRAELNDYMIILQSAALAMEGIRKRSEKSGFVYVTALELSNITSAVLRFEEILPRVDCRALSNAHKELESNPTGKDLHEARRKTSDD